MEEIVCDPLGQMNAFAVDSGSTVAGRVGMFLRSVNLAAQNSGQAQKTTAENSGGVKHSIEFMQRLEWEEQLSRNARRNDTYVLGDTEDFVNIPGIKNKKTGGSAIRCNKSDEW